MIGFSKKLMFAIEAVLYVACNANARSVRSNDITAWGRIPRRYLEPVLQELVHAGLLESVRGPKGGYRLGRSGDQVRLSEIADAVHRTDVSAHPLDIEPTSPLGREVVKPTLMNLADTWLSGLGGITIGDLRARAARAGIDAAA